MRLAADYEDVEVLMNHDDVIKLLKERIISNIFRFQGHRTMKPRSKFILKNLFFFFNLKLNGSNLGFNK